MGLLQAREFLIRDRYRCKKVLGKSNFNITYEAEDTINSQSVVIKALSFASLKDWKILELFEREAKILASLNHSGIPKYFDHFFEDSDTDHTFYLVQELIPGQSLANLITQGWHGNEIEIKAITQQILEILQYLQSYQIAVIHRDIKPDNIIRRDDGKIFLVDFGAVKERYRSSLNRDNTFVGTFGYMSPEQAQGKAYFASDLYSLGATTLFLLTHRSPDELPQEKMRVNFRSQVNISEVFANWLEKMLEPIVEERFKSAKEALKCLQNNQESTSILPLTRPQPKNSRIKLVKTNQCLKITIPPAGLQRRSLKILLLALSTNAFTLLSTWATVHWQLPILLYLFLLPFWLISLASLSILTFATATSSYLKIEPKRFRLGWHCLGFNYYFQGKTANIKNASLEIKTNPHQKKSIYAVIQEDCQKHKFCWGTTVIEKTWLVAEIKDFLEKRKPLTKK
ncbi:MAG: serine/threonine-protein kinase [Spirulinaceae cyanobacterium]